MTDLHRLAKKDSLPAVGRDIDAWCSKCKLDLGHTITAMVDGAVVQVRCNTCTSVHRFKAPAAERIKRSARSPRSRTKAKAKADKVTKDVRVYQRRIADRDLEQAVKYSPRLDPTVGSLIDHSKFGIGIVEAVADGKAAVLFDSGKRLLVVGR